MNRKKSGVLFLLLASEVFYVCLVRLDAVNGTAPVLAFLASMSALFVLYLVAYRISNSISGSRFFFIAVIAGAILFRFTLLPAGLPHKTPTASIPAVLAEDLRGNQVTYEPFLLFDSDVWRYLWDGHVWSHGINPYEYAPSASSLDRLSEEVSDLTDDRSVWSDIRQNVNHPEIPTIYAPLTQFIFRIVHFIAPGSVAAIKVAAIIFDFLAIVFVALSLRTMKKPASWLLLYAWNPLLIKVTAGSGHIDSVVAAAIAGTCYYVIRNNKRAAAVFFGLAILSKLAPIVLFPFIAKRIGWKFSSLAVLISVCGYLPFMNAGQRIFDGTAMFASQWEFNAGIFGLVQLMLIWAPDPSAAARAVSMLLIIIAITLLAIRDSGYTWSFPEYASLGIGLLLLFSPAVMPWYTVWILPAAAIAGQRVWIFFTAFVCISFLVMIDGTESLMGRWIEYSLLFCWAAFEFGWKHLSACSRSFANKSKWKQSVLAS